MGKQANLFINEVDVDYKALEQFYETMRQPFVLEGALMPDAHAGYTLPIGAVVMTQDVIVPSYIGFDIGCGVLAMETCVKAADLDGKLEQIRDYILEDIPVGFNHHKHSYMTFPVEKFSGGKLFNEIYSDGGFKQLGTLGGGNHMIEIGVADDTGNVWVIIHSGSRNVGHTIASHYMAIASGTGKASEGHHPLDIKSEEGIKYENDLNGCYNFALTNREIMSFVVKTAIEDAIGGSIFAYKIINKIHNFAAKKIPWIQREESDGIRIHRKGATAAALGELGVIPGNLRDGTFIVEGLGNRKSLHSCSHGAGRVYGRAKAKELFTLDDFNQAMIGSDVLCNITEKNIDESPMAYKNIFEVMELQKDLVSVVSHVRPILNIKA